MIDLEQRSEPYEIVLPCGLSVTVKPLTTAGMAAAQAAACRSVEAIERQIRERQEAGLPLDGLPVREEKTGRDQRPINVVINVNAADANSFRASQGQIAAEMARAIDRASRNR